MAIVGLDANRPINVVSGRINPTINPDLAGDVSYVRINFVRGPWDSPEDRGWRERYDQIVDGYLERGIQVYGLIGHEIMLVDPERRFLGSQFTSDGEAWIKNYVRRFVTIVKYFRGRVHVWESFNEPNNWHPGMKQSWISPFWFAKMLADVYRGVKITNQIRDVTLVSGPLLAHSFSGINLESTAAAYLEETFQAGKRFHGWDQLRDSYLGSYPLDGLGYHLYVEQTGTRTPHSVADTIRLYLDQIFRVWRQEDGLAARKKIYISEFGWQSQRVGQQKQAQNMRAAFDLFREEPRVAIAIWFGTQDFPDSAGSVESWGLFPWTHDRVDQNRYKPAYKMLQQIAAEDKGPPSSSLVADTFQFPIGRPGHNTLEHFRRDTSFISASYHKLTGAWAPGEDWNLLTGYDSDLGEPVYAVANGRVVTSDHFPIWGNIIVIEHQLPNRKRVWSQYAYLDQRQVEQGEWVKRGDQIATIGKGEKGTVYAHLHFEIRQRDLPPNNWFPMVANREQVIINYLNPSAFIKNHQKSYSRWGHEFIIDSEDTNNLLGRFQRADVPYWFNVPFGLHGSTLWTYASSEREENWAYWIPKLRQRGRYEVFAFVPRSHANTRNAEYTIRHQDGDSRVLLSQYHFADEWVSLGVYRFQAGESAFVRLTDVTGEPLHIVYERKIAFDAIKWVFLDEEEPPLAQIATQWYAQAAPTPTYYQRAKSSLMPLYWRFRDRISGSRT
ncbi:MAG: peptidoglycan DD-metalloendopeptidase family protein [Ardenticatenaceae bacterium]